jgi:hypothetical protein
MIPSQKDSIDNNYLSLTSNVTQSNFTFSLSFLLIDSFSVLILYHFNFYFFHLSDKTIDYKDIIVINIKKSRPLPACRQTGSEPA